MRTRLRCHARIVFAAAIAVACARAAAAQDGPFADATTEWSPVTIGSSHLMWRVDRVTGGVQRDGRFGWIVAGERQQRTGVVDWDVLSSGFRRLGDWTVSGTIAATPTPHFLYRYAAEGAVARRLFGGFVLQGGYRHLSYPVADVRILQPSAAWYFRRGDIEARTFLVQRTDADRLASVALVRGEVDVSRRVRLGGGGARGTRVFDIAALPDFAPRGWVAFGTARIRVASQWSVAVSMADGHEDPAFSQRTVSVGLRRSMP